VGAFAHPVVEAVDAFADEVAALWIVDGVDGVCELFEFGFSAFEVGADLFLDESPGEAFEVDGGLVVSAAVAVRGGLADGAEGFQGAQALADRAFADGKALDKVVEREGGRRDEQQPVDFADGAWEAEHADSVGKEIDHLLFKAIDICTGRGRVEGSTHAMDCEGFGVLFNLF
jgi:hypothetical protein